MTPEPAKTYYRFELLLEEEDNEKLERVKEIYKCETKAAAVRTALRMMYHWLASP